MKKLVLLIILFLIPSFVFASDNEITIVNKSDACNMQDNVYNQTLQTQWDTWYLSRADSFIKRNNTLIYPVNVSSKKTYSWTNASVYLFIYSCNSKKVVKKLLIDRSTNDAHTLSFQIIPNSSFYSINYGLVEWEQAPWWVIDTQKNTVYAFESSKEYIQKVQSCLKASYYFCGFIDFSYEKNALFAKFKSSDINSPERNKEETYKIDMNKKKIIKQ